MKKNNMAQTESPCAWCDAESGINRDPGVSVGICPRHYQAEMERIDGYLKRRRQFVKQTNDPYQMDIARDRVMGYANSHEDIQLVGLKS